MAELEIDIETREMSNDLFDAVLVALEVSIEILDGYLAFGLDVLPKLSIRTLLIQLPHFRNARHNGLLANFDYFAQQILKHQDSELLY